MKDVQKSKPKNELDIDKVGIKKIKVPLTVMSKQRSFIKTVGEVSMSVNLPHQYRGTHMSRFIEILNKYIKKDITPEIIDKIALDVLNKLNAEKSIIELEFPHFISKNAPVSKKKSLSSYQCKNIRIAKKGEKEVVHVIEVNVPITTVCPCSKEISRYGAHNQRGIVKATIKLDDFIWIEDIIKLIEKEASCPIYSLLKRPDEKYVTEKAYNNPKFVEDLVRDISLRLKKEKRVGWYNVECENHESIHNHNVYAQIKDSGSVIEDI